MSASSTRAWFVRSRLEPNIEELSNAEAASVRRYAWRSLATVVSLFVVVQVASVPAGLAAFGNIYNGADTHSTWHAYLAGPAPEVLFLGASDARADVDTQEIARLLSVDAGRPVTVGRLGIVGEGPDFFEVLAYRVMSQPHHPRLLVVSLGMIEFNSSYVFDPTADLWQISDPIDYGFMSVAYRADPYRERLLRDWLLPYFVSYRPVGTAVQCQIKAVTNKVMQLTSGRSAPLDPTTCDESRGIGFDKVMTDPVREKMEQLYRNVYMRNFQFDDRQARHLANLVAMAKHQGAMVMLLTLPTYQLDRLYPDEHAALEAKLENLAAGAGVGFANLMVEFNTSPELWSDPIHLNSAGARALAPRLSTTIVNSRALR
jgi:hypothetical protein